MSFAYYDRDADIAWFPTGDSDDVVSERVPGGLRDYDRATRRLVAIEVWDASTRLSANLLDALPAPEQTHGTTAGASLRRPVARRPSEVSSPSSDTCAPALDFGPLRQLVRAIGPRSKLGLQVERLRADLRVVRDRASTTSTRLTAAGVLACSTLLGGVLLAVDALDLTHGDRLTRDVAAIGDLPWWAGAMSTLGLMTWAAAAAACGVAAAVLRAVRGPEARFLAMTAVLAIVLGIDDALLIHDAAVVSVGLDETLFMAALLGAATLWAVRFRARLLASKDRLLLGLAVVFFAGSVTSDMLPTVSTVAEDWMKYTGLMAFAAWCVRTSVAALRDAIGTEARDRGSAERRPALAIVEHPGRPAAEHGARPRPRRAPEPLQR